MPTGSAAGSLTDTERDLLVACEGLLAEFDKQTRYGSRMAIAANEAVAYARAAVARTRAEGRARR